MVATETRSERTTRPGAIGATITDLLGREVPVRIDVYDGSSVGPRDAGTRLVVRSPDAFRYMVTAPGELGFARAYVAGELEVDGDIFDALSLRDHLPHLKLGASQWLALARLVGTGGLRRPPVPAEEARLHGRRHSKERDAAAISHHYDVSNDFYRMVLGPSMTYSCAVWSSPDVTLEDAQAAKYDLICRKLGLRPGMRLLDVGCGWGGMVMHAARHYGVEAVGVTLSRNQAEYATRRGEGSGPATTSRSACRTTATSDGRFDAISSIGMFEHVGLARLGEYFTRLLRAARAVRPAAQPRHQPAGRQAQGAFQPPRLHRPLRVPRRRAARGRLRRVADAAVGVRGAPRREPARALRAHAAPVGREPRSELGRRRRQRSARRGPGCGASTWPARRSASKPAARRSTRCSRRAPTTGAAACPGGPTGTDAAIGVGTATPPPPIVG